MKANKTPFIVLATIAIILIVGLFTLILTASPLFWIWGFVILLIPAMAGVIKEGEKINIL